MTVSRFSFSSHAAKNFITDSFEKTRSKLQDAENCTDVQSGRDDSSSFTTKRQKKYVIGLLCGHAFIFFLHNYIIVTYTFFLGNQSALAMRQVMTLIQFFQKSKYFCYEINSF